MNYFVGGCLLLILNIFPNFLFSQTYKVPYYPEIPYAPTSFVKKIFNSYDPAYMEKTKTDYVLVLRGINWLDTYQLNLSGANLTLKSDLCYNLGLSAGYKMLFVGYSVNLNNLLFGQKVERTQWKLNLASNVVTVELHHLQNKGQSKVYRYAYEGISLDLDQPFKGLKTKVFGVDMYYYTNNRHYSNSAAYADNHRYRQLKSAGSFITGFSYSSNDLYFNLSELFDQDEFAAINNVGIQHNVYNTYCLNLGYGYNYLFAKNWLTNLSMIPSLGVKDELEKAKMSENLIIKNRLKFALIQNFPKSFWGLNCQYNTNWYFTDGNSIANSVGNFNILFGMRL